MKTFTEIPDFTALTGVKPDHLARIIALLQTLFPDLKRIIIFGSRARGEFSQGADIDLALDCGQLIENRQRLQEAADVLNVLRSVYQCDVVDYHRAKDLFLALINQDGIVVWSK